MPTLKYAIETFLSRHWTSTDVYIVVKLKKSMYSSFWMFATEILTVTLLFLTSTHTEKQQNTLGRRIFNTVPLTDCFSLCFTLFFFTCLLPSGFIFCLKFILHIISSECGLIHLHNLVGTRYLWGSVLTFSTEMILPCSSVLCRWVMHLVASSAVDMVTKP